MPFDTNLVLCDGSVDWTYASLVTSGYGVPTSATRNAGGFAVIDLLSTLGGPSQGLTVVLILDDTSVADADELTLTIESCAAVTFASAVHELTQLDLAAATTGVILGSEAPCTIMRRVAPSHRYIRAKAVVTSGDDFKTGYIFLLPWGFNRL